MWDWQLIRHILRLLAILAFLGSGLTFFHGFREVEKGAADEKSFRATLFLGLLELSAGAICMVL